MLSALLVHGVDDVLIQILLDGLKETRAAFMNLLGRTIDVMRHVAIFLKSVYPFDNFSPSTKISLQNSSTAACMLFGVTELHQRFN